MNRRIIFIGMALSAPGVVFAQTIQALIGTAGDIAGLLISIFMTLAFVVFFYGLGIFILNAGDEKKRDEGKPWMLWSLVALVVLTTIWGLIGFLQRTVGNEDGPARVGIVIPRL